ncbi:uncharacterized protein LOC131014729 [Salvia miltiorrhiza]|uniref:uncharacterized protein LOC131014729 n=1 Tax=Salvia miltiorrhiza TaxID=226208 RepID=UPI0025AD341D|nr:uncharacterized protein LOC131014729 [Salvia miltiorrhiza]
MSLGVDDSSTPKLSLSRLPCKPKHPIQMLTPPLHPSLSIPFQWEEAPGKPRFPADDDAARCLDLPPRLNAQFTIMPSPAMTPLSCSFSFRRGPGSARFGGSRRWRSWGSFKFREEARGGFDLSQTLGDFFMSEKNSAHVQKMRGITRVRSFFHFSTINSNLLDIYARFKQAIPWRRRR